MTAKPGWREVRCPTCRGKLCEVKGAAPVTPPGKAVEIKCPKCNTMVTVDGDAQPV